MQRKRNYFGKNMKFMYKYIKIIIAKMKFKNRKYLSTLLIIIK